MSESSEAAEEIVKFTLEGMEYSLKISGNVSKEVAAALYKIMNDKQQTSGKTTLVNMMKSGRPVQIFQVQKDRLRDFAKEAKRYGVVYVLVKDKSETDKDFDIIVKEEDKAKIDRILQKFEHDAPTEEQEEKIKQIINKGEKVEANKEYLENNSPSKTTNEKVESSVETNNENIVKEDKEFTNEIKENQTNPFLALTEKESQSKNSLKKENKEKRKSVRAELKQISNELEEKEQRKKEPRSKNYSKNYKRNYYNKTKESR